MALLNVSNMQKKIAAKPETLVLVFTDIEGSTKIASQLKAQYADVVDIHDRIIRDELRKYEGKEANNAGDGFFLIFKNIEYALLFAVNVQKKIAAQDWPKNIPLKIRIGAHIGVAYINNERYTGEEVNRCSRICDAGYGGQVLLSKQIASLVKDRKPQGIDLIDKGYYALKDFHTPMHLFQLHIPGIGERTVTPRSWAASPILAILPLKDLSVEKDDQGFGGGIAEDLIINLSKIPELRVVSRSTSFALKDSNLSDAISQLRATVVLEGSLMKEANHIRVSVFLVEIASGLNLWSQQYEGDIIDLFTFQDDIAYNITETLQVADGFKTHRGMKALHSQEVGAYQHYLRGRRFFYQFSENSIQFAIRMYKKAIEIDSKYALAFCGLTECYSYLYANSVTDKRNLIQANQLSKVAIVLDPQLAEAWSSRGLALTLQKDFEKGAECFEKAMELDPMLFEAPYQYARMSFTQGLPKKATDLYAKAMEIRPDDYQSPLLSAQSYDVMGHPEIALEMRKKGIEIAEANLKFNPGDTRALSLSANGLAAIGESKKAISYLQRALILEPNDPMLLYNAGCIYAMCDKEEEAMSCLEKSAQTGLTLKEWYIHDDNLDSVRNTTRFKKMLSSMK
jgi:TolB-like protein/Tfp pilus assembly protein PilF